jgi:hypothetical protein
VSTAARRWARPGGHLLALALALTLVLVGAVGSWAYWGATSVPGGGGTAGAGSVNTGATPTVNSAGAQVTVTWAARTLANGTAVAGYEVRRYPAGEPTAQTILTACTGTVNALTCTESDVPGGSWQYTTTPLFAQHWRGAESARSATVVVDATPPVSDISLSNVTGGAHKSGNTVYYRGVEAGSFTLTNAVSGSGSAAASSETSILAGTSSGWTHTASTVSAPTGGPYVSNPFSWTAATTSAPTETVISRDVSNNTAQNTLSFVDDSVAPTPGTVSYPDGYQPDQSVVVTASAGTDSGSGVLSAQLQRSKAALTAGTCGTFDDFVNVGGDDPGTYTDSAVTDDWCYRYRFVVTDRVGNRHIATTTNVAKVDSSFGGPALRTARSYSVLAGTGVASTGATTVSGDLGVSPAGTIAGFPPGVVYGDTHLNDASSAQALTDLVSAYNAANSRTPTNEFSGDLIGQTFYPGVHHTSAAFALTGTLTLDANGDPNAIFIFQVDAAMNTAAASNIVLTDSASASNVYWQVEGAVGTGANSFLSGTILAAGGITLGAGTQLTGRALSYGTVTMAANTVRFTAAQAPTIAITGGATAVTDDQTPTISGTTSAVAGRTVTVKVNGQVLTTTVASDNTWTVTAAELTAGTYSVVTSVRDADGNGASASQSLTVEVNPDPVTLYSADSYSVLAGTGVVNTGTTTLSGDLGVSPSNSITGAPTVAGQTHAGDAAAAAAREDLITAYSEVNARTPHRAVVGNLVLINGASAANVYWQAEGAVGTGANSTFRGTILTAGAITLGDSTKLIGRALSTGTVTLATNTIRFTE